ncbi:hypothetical protein CAN33_0028820 [Aspergillus niger]|uniref:Polyketide synthase n=2 Tax=Aspergillus niger TaxID=5061 RepID=A0A3F3RSG2_ASPNG|nr:hypothetical protein CBS147345_9332 [Aspergillus niger]KAI3040476.1 hypothetical protein CBS147352_9901 [Aspergillus niger]TPR04255.1 hypothetical protein CAN33_0028820 [Aspergillus niger]SPB51107.1 unnamed protein product [Aspergillus niger]
MDTPLSSSEISPRFSNTVPSSVSSMTPNADPSVIVGLACRVPGATNPSQLWENIVAQKDLQRKMPADRFNVDAFYHPDGTNKGTTNAKFGYFLDQDIGMFDAGFFRISGKEAEAMDPQQRLLLEVVYEALEDAGITLDEVNGSNTAVYCGSFTNDYNAMVTKDLEYYPKYTVTGTGNAILSNRISYFYNLHGPSVTIDTACSSSLVCFHLGNQSLSQNESDIAIVVGSALHFDPNVFITMTDLGMLSSDGRCRTFDSMGSGYVRGEGICAAVLKRRRDAVYSGDNIRAVVRASGVNHDGIKQGITLPNTDAQEKLIRRTYDLAGLDPNDTQYFEAHGTGTARGDPIEARAIGAVFGSTRSEPLYVGSVKSNIGHLEGASGLAGIIKATLALEKSQIPPNMHFKRPNPEIKFDEWKIQVPQDIINWPASANGIRRASINSFGYGGTNAHVILDAYKPEDSEAELQAIPAISSSIPVDRPYLIPLSAHSTKAGALWEDKLTKYLSNEPIGRPAVSDLAVSLSTRRTMHGNRSFIIGKDMPTVLQGLEQPPSPAAAWTRPLKETPRLGFVFTGQGAQWFAMGRKLIQQSYLYRQTLERCDAVLQSLPDGPDWTVLEELLRTEEASRLKETRLSQPICTAMQLATVCLLKQWGIEPSAVVGHSSGEVAAAYAAGILTFENAMIAAYYRGLYMSSGVDGSMTTDGAMMAVGLTEAEAKKELETYTGQICVAAVNSASSLTLSGDKDAIVRLRDSLVERKIFARLLQVAQAFHSHHMLPLAPKYEEALKNCVGFGTSPARVRMFSSVTARLARPGEMGAGYWTANMTGTVRFSDALTGILLNEEDEQNVDILVEIGPHPALKGPSRQVMNALKLNLPYLASLTRGVDDYESMLTLAGQLFQYGFPVDLIAVNSDHFLRRETGIIQSELHGKRLRDLPTYAWDHKRYWSETRPIREHRLRKQRHSILGARMPGMPERTPHWRNYLRLKEIPWLADHVIDGNAVFPAAGYFSMAIEAAVSMCAEDSVIKEIALRDLNVQSALLLSDSEEGTEVIMELRPATQSAKSKSALWYEFTIYSYGETKILNEHCSGLVSVETNALTLPMRWESSKTFDDLAKESQESIPAETLYDHLTALGLQYGPSFQLLTGDVQTGPGFALAGLDFQPSQFSVQAADLTIAHPTLLDASFHAIFPAIESALGRSLDEPLVPTFVRSLKVSGDFLACCRESREQKFQVTCFTRLPGPRVALSDLTVCSKESNMPLLQFKGLEVTALGSDKTDNSAGRSLFFRTRWQPAFTFLGPDHPAVAQKNVSEILDFFAHQFPDTRILHISDTVDGTRDVLKYLGGRSNERRRFHSITPVFQTQIALEEIDALSQEWPGLVEISEPEPNAYGLVVLSSDAAGLDSRQFVKEGGFVLALGPHPQPEGLHDVFFTKDLAVWQKSTDNAQKPKQLSLILPSCPSQRTLDIADGMETQHGSSVFVTRTSLAALSNEALQAEDIVVLANLDEDVLFEHSSSDQSTFLAIKRLLTTGGKNIVWVLEGGSMDAPKPEHAMIIGLARVARSENDQLRFVTLDLPRASTQETVVRHVWRLLDRSITEDEVTVRDNCIFIPRIEADDQLNSKLRNGTNSQPREEPLGAGRPLALKIGRVGLLETLVFEDDEQILDTQLADDEIEIEVKASAINFRDIAASMGIIDDYKLGDECAGIVTRIGAQVNPRDFQVGDRVAAWRPGQGAHKTIVRNPASLSYKLGDMSFVDAASLPCILTTAYYSLVHVAHLQPGETVLIHSAAGGVGQMAIQVAQYVGARVIATVGSQAKRSLLKSRYGLADDMIFNSRDDSFVRDVLDTTGGRGVDVILNSLAGKLLHATWSCVAPFGRFIEIGKRDIHENSKIDMDPFRRNVAFASVDLITIFEKNKPLGARLLKECGTLVHEGHITPPETVTELPYSDAVKAFRLLQMGKHTGKVVLVPHAGDRVLVRPSTYRNQPLFKHEKTYLLVGGLGGLGRTLAEWMVRKNARRLAFLSRSGADKEEAKRTVEWLRERGVSVTVFKGDVSRYEDVECAVKAIDNLGGIFQAAMVLQDAPLENMSYQQWQICVEPKVKGTYNLHQATLGTQLDFFICFSSASGSIGSKGQANYSSANCYLDALMRHRREMGLAGTTMNCGMIVGIGAVAANQALLKVMMRSGYDGVNKEELLYQIEEAVLSDNSKKVSRRGVDLHQTITGINMTKADFYWCQKPLYRNLYNNHEFLGQTAIKQGTKSLASQLQGTKSIEERTTLVLSAFIEKVADVLSVSVDSIEPANPLSAYGLDSIIAVEFRKWFSRSVGVEIALFDVLGAPSILALVTKASGLITITTSNDHKAENVDNEGAKGNEDQQVETQQRQLNQPIPPAAAVGPVPMSSFQQRLWFIHNFGDDKTFLNLSITSYLEGNPDATILEKALNELVNRNAILRTGYTEGDEFAEQTVLDMPSISLERIDVSSKPNPTVSLQDVIQCRRAIELDIEEGEVVRPILVRLSDDQHALVLICHHIAIDRGSAKSSLNQLTGIYDAIRQGRDLDMVPRPGVSYADFAVWHNRLLSSPSLQADLTFWKENLSGMPKTCKLLPFAKSERPLHDDLQRTVVSGILKKSLLNRMKRICSQSGATPFQFLLAAFRAFIFRYTEDRDLGILMIDGDRPHPDLEDVLGFFVNMTPIRCQDSCEGAFDQLLEATKTRTLEAMSHNKAPFDSIVDVVKAKKTTSHFPLAQIALNYQIHGTFPVYRTQDFNVHDVQSVDVPTACDMQLEALEHPERGLDLRLEYSSTLYGSGDMNRFFDNFVTFMSSLIRDHRQPIAEVNLCGALEIAHLEKNFWNTQFTENPWGNVGVCQRIMENATKQPEAVAIAASDGAAITYSELVERAQRVAATLKASGVTERQKICVLVDPGVDAVIALLAILLTRSCYVALDSSFAVDRLAFMASDCGAGVLLFGPQLQGLAETVASKSKSGLRLLDTKKAALCEDRFVGDLPSVNEDPFFIIYTSGSTGKPKGVVLSHANTQQMLASVGEYFRFTSDDRFLQQSSLCFDLSVVQIFSALTAGARVCVAKHDIRKDPAALAAFMHETGVTITYFTPTHFALLLEHSWETLHQCSQYRAALFAGERLPVRIARAFYDLQTPAVVYNTWSPSELVVQTTIHKVDKPDDDVFDIPIGRPLPNCRHYIVDAVLNPLPAGFVGEICVGGAQVGVEYLNRPLANATSFVRDLNPTPEDQARGWKKMFRTGDKGSFLPNGLLTFKGRIAGDKQIKLRGFRIDLGEVEQVLYKNASTPDGQGIVDISVIARDSEKSDAKSPLTDERRLIAFVIPKKPLQSTQERDEYANHLHRTAQGSLNQYMCPNGYQFLERLPMTIGGKVDRRSLLTMKLDLAQHTTTCTDSRPVTEVAGDDAEILQGVTGQVCSLLGIDRSIAPNDNFFELGGQSILLLRLQSRLKKKFKVTLKLQELIHAPTPLAIAGMIQKQLKGPAGVQNESASKSIDWSEEISLPASLMNTDYSQLSRFPRTDVSSILLTGIDTFIGLHMLATILSNNHNATVYVIGIHDELTADHLVEGLTKYKLLDAHLSTEDVLSRTRAVPGKMTSPRFGLAEEAFRNLADTVRVIFNIAADVSLLKTYVNLKPVNTSAILTLIELATSSHGHLLEIHHLSTWSVPHLQTWKKTSRTRAFASNREEDPSHFTPPTADEYGYFKSRWAAEMYLTQAAAHGVPVSIYRASSVSGSRATNVPVPEMDFISNMIMHMIQHRAIPEINSSSLIDEAGDFVVDFLPVDALTSSMYTLASEESAAAPGLQVYHLGSSQPLPLQALVDVIPSLDQSGAAGKCRVVPMQEWLRLVSEGASEEEQLHWMVVKKYFQHGHSMFALDKSHTVAALKKAGKEVEFPAIDVDYLKRLLDERGPGLKR